MVRKLINTLGKFLFNFFFLQIYYLDTKIKDSKVLSSVTSFLKYLLDCFLDDMAILNYWLIDKSPLLCLFTKMLEVYSTIFKVLCLHVGAWGRW